MTLEERELLATVIMGWHTAESSYWLLWLDSRGLSQCKKRDWQPDVDDTQAVMMIEKLVELGYDVELMFNAKRYHKGHEYETRATLCLCSPAMMLGWVRDDVTCIDSTLAGAISKAALQVAQKMEERVGTRAEGVEYTKN